MNILREIIFIISGTLSLYCLGLVLCSFYYWKNFLNKWTKEMEKRLHTNSEWSLDDLLERIKNIASKLTEGEKHKIKTFRYLLFLSFFSICAILSAPLR